ncbi:MAG: Protein translocase subunit SecY [Fimbriimonadales bacterium]|nr:MAG: preprotein translocase subunit SecY [Armatimonadota bacterium]MBV6502659.1 Protein translocase subunit SecY [Fimbriimonadales bacterium]MCE7898494.1 preprotein translocase subunit SecY [Armatimonadetes bacterium ATM1]MDL1928213.1 preprotein translocase subunit SecY [Fimbriimonadia bacterium ATM]MBC6968667.1 preprotein translocase subunit SecY [Armatimonadota bacterium]
MKLADTIRAAWAEPELRQRILFVFAMFGVYAVGLHVQVPVPGYSPQEVLAKLTGSGGLLDMLNMFTGGALRRLSIFALGLNPYITASIIMQLMTIAIPSLKKEQMEGGQYERMKRAQRTRALTIVLCVFQGLGFIQMLTGGLPLAPLAKVMIIVFWMAGAMMVLWLGEQIQEKGIGQGVSLMIFAGIVISFPLQIERLAKDEFIQIWQILLLAAIFIGVTAMIVFFTQAQRRITIQHMRRNFGSKMLGGGSSFLPIPVNAAGVIPIIFAISLLYMPQTFASFAPGTEWAVFWTNVGSFFSPNPQTAFWYHWVSGSLVYAGLIFFFTYFYTAIQFNVEDIAAHLKRSGAYIPGVRQGKQTEEFLDQVISRITVVGALFLAFVSLIPFYVPSITQINSQTFNLVGGTSLLIIVSVVLDLMRQVEANLIMRGYNK